MFKKILAIMLTLILATTSFAVVPIVSADEPANLSVVEGTSATSKTWAEKTAMLTADSNFVGTTLQVSDIYENKANPAGNEVNIKDINVDNRVTGVIVQNSTDAVIKEYRTTALASMTDSNIYDNDTSLQGVTGDTSEMISPVGTGNSYALNKQNGAFDAKVTVTLSASTEISKLYTMYHPGIHLSWCAYEIYVGENFATLYEPQNKVASFDYMSGYYNDAAGSKEFSLNGVHEGDTQRRSEGQIWTFGGSSKPQGSYVGYKIIYAQGGVRDRLDLYEIGVFGEQNLKILDGVENVTSSNWETKKSYLAAGSKYQSSTLQVSDIYSFAQETPTTADSVLEEIVGTDAKNNIISSVKVVDYANNEKIYSQSQNYNVYNGEGFYGATDGKIHQGTVGGTYISSGLAITNCTGSYKDHLLNGGWDAKVTLRLANTTKIDTIYSSQHPNAQLSWQAYEIYVGDNEEELYNSENLVSWYDYYYGYNGFKGDLGYDTRHLNGNNTSGDDNRRAETQIWSYTGTEKPHGKFVGFKIVYGQYNRTRLDISDIGVLGSVPSDIHGGKDLTLKSSVADNTIYDSSAQYHETAFIYSEATEYKMLYPISEVISVRSYDLKTVYEENIDYIIDNGVLKLTENTSIPIYQHSDENDLLSLNSQNVWERTSYWASRQWRFQINVSYTYTDKWDGEAYYTKKPESKLCEISNFDKKAKSGETTNVVFIGDSISTGCDSSAMSEVAYLWKDDIDATGNDASTLQLKEFNRLDNLNLSVLPDWGYIGWPKQVTNALIERYGDNIKYYMRAIGSSRAEWASKEQNMKFLYGEGEGTSNLPTPDIAFIAYGMNENLNSKDKQNEYTRKIIDFIRARNPQCSIVLVSSFVPNFYFTDNLDRHELGYYELVEEYDNLIVAPVNATFQSMLSVKSKYDYTANLVNHPNDFGANVYADVILSVLDDNVNHEYSIVKYNKEEHWNECQCGEEEPNSRESHTGGTATCVDKAECRTCHEIYGEVNKSNHKSATPIRPKSATCLAAGNTEGVSCSACGTNTSTVIPKKVHSYTGAKTIKPATLSADGAITQKCVNGCNGATTLSKISRIKTVSVASSVAYTGKALTPKVTVKDAAGKTLNENTDYTLAWSKNKAVGKATVKVTFKGNYSGTITLTFKIVPKKTSISSLKAGKKSFTVKYKKQTSGAGYEIQYSTSKSFKGAKTVKIAKNKTVSKTVKKLKAKKTYYVRIRVVKSNYKSDWSSAKKVKVK